MTTFVFFSENDNFKDILKDEYIKKYIMTKIKWPRYLRIDLYENSGHDKIVSYIALKYADLLSKKQLIKDYRPIDGVDYISKVPPHLKNQRRK